ncbi:MAG: RNA methyltransferase [Patescibacteria group bacterium]|nr:MAG: RNA methyltransferase [Patescibacteria group bacterium]
MKLNAEELRRLEEEKARGVIKKVKRNPIYFILENIYDTYNIGGLFRLADALAIEKMYLVGDTETPPNSRIKKASIGTYKIVDWQYFKTTKEAINDLNSKLNPPVGGSKTKKLENNTLHVPRSTLYTVAVEQSPKSVPYNKTEYRFPIALIFGNESFGVKPETLEMVDKIVEIPMYGINKSLNVIVAAAIVSYHIMISQTPPLARGGEKSKIPPKTAGGPPKTEGRQK